MRPRLKFELDLEHLPTDVELLHTLIRDFAAAYDRLAHQMLEARRRQYGRKAETISEAQLGLFEKQIADRLAALPDLPPKPEVKKDPPKRHGRRIPAANLPTVHEHFDLPEGERFCPGCHAGLKMIGPESRRVLDVIPPKYFVRVQTRNKWACPDCGEGVVTVAFPELPVPKGLATASLLAHVVTNKFTDHQPLYRQSMIFGRHGLDISRSTLDDWVAETAYLLEPLHALMKEMVLASKVIHSDDTVIAVLEGGKRRSRPVKKKARIGRFWTWVGDGDHPYTVFTYSPSRKQEWPVQFLKGWKGYLQADAYPGYHPLYKSGVKEVACNAHARRKFDECLILEPEKAGAALAYYSRLYEIEARYRGRPPEEIAAARQMYSAPLMADFRNWLELQAAMALPKSAWAKALGYALRHWQGLTAYLEDGCLKIDNNAAENALRPIALGRKNYLFVGSDEGGYRAAILYSIIVSCKRHGIEPFDYLKDVLGKIGNWPARRLGELLPHVWKAERQEGGPLAA
jgi:transposase